jgi:hypothetical protein
MSRRALPFTEDAVRRAARGAVSAGLTVQRVEVDATGKIVIVCASERSTEAAKTPEEIERAQAEAMGWAS